MAPTKAGAAESAGQSSLLKMGGELEEHREALLGQLRKVRTAVQRYRLGAKSAEAALESIHSAPKGARVYKQIARLFVLETPSELEEELKKKKANCSQQQESLKGVETQLIAKVKSVEEQLVDIQKQIAEKARVAAAEDK